MTSNGGKDYETGRRLMTEEVNAVVRAIFESGPATIVVNDSHGDMQNLLHTQLDPRVEYIQSNIKPLGMVQGLDATFDGMIFIGYHAMAGTDEIMLCLSCKSPFLPACGDPVSAASLVQYGAARMTVHPFGPDGFRGRRTVSAERRSASQPCRAR